METEIIYSNSMTVDVMKAKRRTYSVPAEDIVPHLPDPVHVEWECPACETRSRISYTDIVKDARTSMIEGQEIKPTKAFFVSCAHCKSKSLVSHEFQLVLSSAPITVDQPTEKEAN